VNQHGDPRCNETSKDNKSEKKIISGNKKFKRILSFLFLVEGEKFNI